MEERSKKSFSNYATVSDEELLKQFQTAATGLSQAEAEKRLSQYGKNAIEAEKQESTIKKFLKNFTSLMALLLWVAGFIAFFAGMMELGIAIWLVNVINGIFSFWQQYQAERATAALQKMLPDKIQVIRDGKAKVIVSEEVVPGDIVQIKGGNNIPADGRLLTSDSLQINQSSLTGESATENKEAGIMTAAQVKKAGRFSEKNLVYEGTSVVSGTATFLVLTTGMKTEFGRIAALTSNVVEDKSPLEKELDVLTRQLSRIAILIGVVFFIAAVFFVHYPWQKSFIFALGMIVAFIPEGLLPTVTLSLALAVQNMAKRNALVKHLNSVETLGETTVICSDKTGTLTKNEMTIEKVWLPDGEYQVSGTGYLPNGKVTKQEQPVDLKKEAELARLLRIGTLDNDSVIKHDDKGYELQGSPDEGSILILAMKAGFSYKEEAKKYPRLKELPFDSNRKRMTTIHQAGTGRVAFTKGGINEVLSCCTTYEKGGKQLPLSEEMRQKILHQNDNYARDGLRMLAFAYRPLAESEKEYSIDATEKDLCFVGLSASQDPPRDNVIEAIQECHTASIRIVMATGDYGLTAESTARKIGVVKGDDVRVITGDQLSAMTDDELEENLKYEVIFARVAPEQKYRIVSKLQDLGEIVASTGDGVNDAPALKKADIGVAMGIAGTDVAKAAADMILTDDNFASIVRAIEEGRTVYANIRKFLLYILNSNMPEAVPSILFLFSRGAIPLPLTVMQILSIDLGTDMLPALSLATEKTEAGTMHRPPRKRGEHLLTKRLIWKAFGWYGMMASIVSIGAYFFVNYLNGWPNVALASSGDVYVMATTMTLAAIIFAQIGAVFNCRTDRQSVFKIGIFSNRRVIFAVLFEVALLASLMYIPILQDAFGTTTIQWDSWKFLFCIPIPIILIEEARKAIVRKFF
ncbi:MAG: cation-transporting P-type ATPase [Enterococcaceae bacterium]|jgi:calcium-translocating P-type ATPase|nr:cation-transporting P-type ATPase [Enterococcaceae bacterium]MCI1919134.1 cation-transporting P-type ATPase [Enterococcaceae bacterium]